MLLTILSFLLDMHTSKLDTVIEKMPQIHGVAIMKYA